MARIGQDVRGRSAEEEEHARRGSEDEDNRGGGEEGGEGRRRRRKEWRPRVFNQNENPPTRSGGKKHAETRICSRSEHALSYHMTK